MSPGQIRPNDIAQMKESSNWLTALPERWLYSSTPQWTVRYTCICQAIGRCGAASYPSDRGGATVWFKYMYRWWRSPTVDVKLQEDSGKDVKWHSLIFGYLHLSQDESESSLDAAFTSNEQEKKRQYNIRCIQFEHASFTPLIFSANGGL